MTDDRDFSVLPENLGSRLLGLSGESADDDSLTYVSKSLKISEDPKLVAHGRGLVAKAPIQAGELLFVHPPTIQAELSQVLRVYKNKACGSSKTSDGSTTSLLESIAETVLLKEMKRAVKGRKKESNAKVAASFLTLNSRHSMNSKGTAEEIEDDEHHQQQLLRVLLGKGNAEETEKILEECGDSINDNDYLLGIIRHNAFGPDFHHYHRMERELLQNNIGNGLYSRILGHYPLAAMINHSCGPTNATRVFYGEIMVATATQAIPSGTEILWPYCPPISAFPIRSQQLKHGYGFSCLSNRSLLEQKAYQLGIPPPELPVGLANASVSGGGESSSIIDSQLDLKEWERLLKSLEVWYKVVAAKIELPIKTSSDGENKDTKDPQEDLQLLQHGLRLGYTHLYIRYFNEALQQQQTQTQDSQQEESVRARIVAEAEKLHSAFSSVHNACTEHLSLLHLCYELAASTKSSQTTSSIRFWTERLKEVHLCRYSNEVAGKDLDTLRTVLKHTRTVLRTRDGWKNSGSQNKINSFI